METPVLRCIVDVITEDTRPISASSMEKLLEHVGAAVTEYLAWIQLNGDDAQEEMPEPRKFKEGGFNIHNHVWNEHCPVCRYYDDEVLQNRMNS